MPAAAAKRNRNPMLEQVVRDPAARRFTAQVGRTAAVTATMSAPRSNSALAGSNQSSPMSCPGRGLAHSRTRQRSGGSSMSHTGSSVRAGKESSLSAKTSRP